VPDNRRFILITVLGLLTTLPLSAFSSTDEEGEGGNDVEQTSSEEDTDTVEGNEESRSEEEGTTEPTFPESAYKPDISDRVLDLYYDNKINDTEAQMILCGVLMNRPDASAGVLVDCHSMFDNDNTIGNENQTFYESINRTITELLAR
jgi:hypothetical protein